ncbi:hypothetical protein GCM10010149_01370 [Nonomuraea roseoviolacea subsp. roseoviolacea]
MADSSGRTIRFAPSPAALGEHERLIGVGRAILQADLGIELDHRDPRRADRMVLRVGHVMLLLLPKRLGQTFELAWTPYLYDVKRSYPRRFRKARTSWRSPRRTR